MSFNVWPINLPPGPEFLWLYGVMCIFAFYLSRALQILVGSFLDADPRGGVSGPGRVAAAGATGAPLRIGVVPRGDDALVVAYAAGGKARLRQALAAAAAAGGLIEADPNNPRRWGVVPDARPGSAGLAILHAEMMAPGALIEHAAGRAADRLAPSYDRALEDMGFIRTGSARIGVGLVPLAVAGGLVALATVRIAWRHAHFPNAPTPTNLTIAVAITVLVSVVLALTTGGKSTTRTAYLRWLDDVTGSLRGDVLGGRRRGWDELALTVGLIGIAAAFRAPLLGDLPSVMMVSGFNASSTSTHSASSSSDWSSSSSSSSCSSSSSSCSSSSSSCSSSSCSSGSSSGCS